ncbi:histidine phosphatase family protein [Streptomyces sp. NPDC001073]
MIKGGPCVLKLLFVRHGETRHNAQRVLSSREPGPCINSVGVRQAETLAEAVAETPVDAIYCSPLRRAVETAHLLAKGWGGPLNIASDLREVGVGDLEGQTGKQAFDSYHMTLQAWMSGNALDTPLGASGETARQVLLRADNFLRHVVKSHPAGRVLAVSHATFMHLSLSRRSVNLAPDWVMARPLPNTGTALLTLAPNGSLSCVDWCGDRPSGTGQRGVV